MIYFVDSIKCLGVILDNNLKFDNHINSITNKVCITLRRLYSLKAYTPRHVRSRLAHSLLMSTLNYGIEIFSGTWTYNINNIEKILRKIVRYVFDLKIQDHERVTELTPVFLGCTFRDYLNSRILLHFYKIMKIGKPEILVNQFSFINSTRNVQIDAPLIHSTALEFSFLVRVYRNWNCLPNRLKMFSYSYTTYKRHLTDYYNGTLP